ncbi:MAG: TatD family hydrolase [Proteobacteria bacterium]|nr:TatD family hydrolase [Pseudomonadota bacterium]MCH8177602.1 TatD family hydrolase [Pseudomonadota bacterium]
MPLIDSHCHLDDDRFDQDRDQIVERARALGIDRIVIPSTTAKRWPKVKQVAESYPGMYPAYGLHPMFIEQHQRAHLRELDAWLDREKPLAVGECGLDFFHSRVDEQWQIQLFCEQLQLAKNYRLPVIVHVRKATDQVIGLLKKNAPLSGVIHSFSGSLQQALQLIDLGFKLGIAATVGFERAKKLRTVVAKVPDHGLLLESDAPDQPGVYHRGELNEPAYIVEHLETIAVLRETSESELVELLQRNSDELFNFEKINRPH